MIFMVLLECFLSDVFYITTKVVHKLLPLQLFIVSTTTSRKLIFILFWFLLLSGLTLVAKRSKCKNLIHRCLIQAFLIVQIYHNDIMVTEEKHQR